MQTYLEMGTEMTSGWLAFSSMDDIQLYAVPVYRMYSGLRLYPLDMVRSLMFFLTVHHSIDLFQ